MPVVSKNMASLSGGVSQQAASLRLPNQAEEQLNFNSGLVAGLQSRMPGVCAQFGGQSASAFYKVDRDSNNRYNLLISPYKLQIATSYGQWENVFLSGDALEYLGIPAGANPYQAYKTLTLADHTFILNTHKQVKMLAKSSESWKNQALVFIKQVNYSTSWSLTINGVTQKVGYSAASPSSGNADLYVNGAKVASDVSPASNVVAGELGKIGVTGFKITQFGSVLWVRKHDGTSFKIGASDTRSDTCINLVTSKIQRFADLPTVAPKGYICRVVGEIASSADDYYAIFKPDDPESEFGKGVWEETVAPASKLALDARTMPWVLVREDNGWRFVTYDWAEKETGDDDSSPVPAFVGKKLRNMLYYRNRFCLLAQEYFCMTRAGKLNNWWNETAFTLSDSDPIYIDASTDQVVDLYDFGLLQDGLVLFGENGQYTLNTPDVLSPKTASITPVSATSYTAGTGVVSSGTRLYFGYKAGKYYNCSEFGVNSLTGQKEATAITSHVPSYIKAESDVFIAGSDNANALAVTSADTPDTVYIYQYFISGNQKLQAAWHKYTFKDTSIYGMFFREYTLWLYAHKNGQYFTFTVDMSEQLGTQITPCLDFSVTLKSAEPKTTWELPVYLSPTNCKAMYETVTDVLSENTIKSYASRNITVEHPTKELIVGQPYRRLFVFSTQYPTKEQGGTKTAVTTGRFSMQRLILNHAPSGSFKIKVAPLYFTKGTAYEYQYRGVVSGAESSVIGGIPMGEGSFKAPLRGKNTDLQVSLETDSCFPQTIISAEWEGLYTAKARQI